MNGMKTEGSEAEGTRRLAIWGLGPPLGVGRFASSEAERPICAHAFHSWFPATRFLSISVHRATRTIPLLQSFHPAAKMFARQAFRPARTLANVSSCFRVSDALLTTSRSQQSVRRYATEAPKQSSNAALYGALGLGAAGAGYWYLNSSKGAAPTLAASKPAEKTFKGGDQGFVSLVLEDVEVLSPNTKRFRFKLPAEDHVSGLNVACEYSSSTIHAEPEVLIRG